MTTGQRFVFKKISCNNSAHRFITNKLLKLTFLLREKVPSNFFLTKIVRKQRKLNFKNISIKLYILLYNNKIDNKVVLIFNYVRALALLIDFVTQN